MLRPESSLRAIARSLRQVIGPAVQDPYAKTQAFMAAVVLERLGRQLEEPPAAQLERELGALFGGLLGRLGDVPDLAAIAERGAAEPTKAVLGELSAALYPHREVLGDARFRAVRGELRAAMRRYLDRDLAVARAK